MDMKRPNGIITALLAGLGTATLAGMGLAARDLVTSTGSRSAGTSSAGTSSAGSPSAGGSPEKLLQAPAIARPTAIKAARRLNRAAGTLAGSVLFDSAIEHYRGQFHNKAMYTPLVTSSLALAVSAHGNSDTSLGAHRVRDGIYAATALTGLIGTGFHAFNVSRKVGGFSWQNLFYSAPLGAPAALMLSGLLGFLSERVRDTPPGEAPEILGLPAGRVVGAVTGAGILGTVGEAALLHFRGSFHDPFMLLPVTMPPVAAALTAAAAFGDTRAARPATRWWLRSTALLGLVGSLFHIVGVARNMGGWRNWRQNMLNGPPIPAPPAFTGLALAGLAAMGLLEDHPDE